MIKNSNTFLFWLVISLTIFPFFNFLLNGTNLTPHYSENIGNRYFLTMRLIETSEFANPGQGPLIAIFHKWLYQVIGLFSAVPTSNLILKMNIFAYSTMFVGIVFLVIILIKIYCAKDIKESTKTLLLISPIFINYTSFINYQYFMYPDYLPWGQPIILYLVYIFIKLPYTENGPKISGFGQFLYPAVITGIALALKPNYFVFPFLLFGAYAIAYTSKPILNMVKFGLLSFSILALCFTLYYDANWHHILEYIKVFQSFVTSGQVTYNNEFFEEMKQPFSSWSYNSRSIYWWQLALVFFACFLFICQTLIYKVKLSMGDVLIFTVCLFSIAILTFAMFRRGGGSSFNDIFLVFWFAVVIIIEKIHVEKIGRLAYRYCATVGLVLPLSWISAHAGIFFSNDGLIPNEAASEMYSNGSWWNQDLYDWNLSHDLPVIVFTKNNLLLTGSLEDMVMRGAVDGFIGKWDDAEKSELMKKYFSHLHFVDFESKYGSNYDGQPGRRFVFPNHYVFMWSIGLLGGYGPNDRYRLESENVRDSNRLSEFDQVVFRYVSGEGYLDLVREGKCKSWTNIHWKKIIYSCVVDRREVNFPSLRH